MPGKEPVLRWLHFGDLHTTGADQQNYVDFRALIAAANRHIAGNVDFAVLPGDNADNGTDAQFRLVQEAVAALSIPLHILPGDHDFETRSLRGFYEVLGAERLPACREAAGYQCLFLDVVSAGGGGPDFRLGVAQLGWLERALTAASAQGQRAVVFMHVYPADLRDYAAEVTRLFRTHQVACVDMGHTHYNELANDGRTVFIATRSTGQIEEGPVGFSVGAVDRGVVSWRFQPLAGAWPLVMVTHPAAMRLMTDPAQAVRAAASVRALVWGEMPVLGVSATLGGRRAALAPHPLQAGIWQGTCETAGLPEGPHNLTVLATDASGRSGAETVSVLVSRCGATVLPHRHGDGSDRDAVGAWPEKHVLDTRLGPNRNGRKW